MKTRFALVATALSLVWSVASAGYVAPVPVLIDSGARFAQGDMLTARGSLNPFEYIGCGTRYLGAGDVYVFCQANAGDTVGPQASCFSFDPSLVDAIQSISAFSYIRFTWNEDGTCTSLGFSTQSLYLPDFKKLK